MLTVLVIAGLLSVALTIGYSAGCFPRRRTTGPEGDGLPIGASASDSVTAMHSDRPAAHVG